MKKCVETMWIRGKHFLKGEWIELYEKSSYQISESESESESSASNLKAKLKKMKWKRWNHGIEKGGVYKEEEKMKIVGTEWYVKII